jgi:hypothetical protein
VHFPFCFLFNGARGGRDAVDRQLEHAGYKAGLHVIF